MEIIGPLSEWPRVTGLMDSLCIVREFVDDLQSAAAVNASPRI